MSRLERELEGVTEPDLTIGLSTNQGEASPDNPRISVFVRYLGEGREAYIGDQSEVDNELRAESMHSTFDRVFLTAGGILTTAGGTYAGIDGIASDHTPAGVGIRIAFGLAAIVSGVYTISRSSKENVYTQDWIKKISGKVNNVREAAFLSHLSRTTSTPQ